MLTHYQGPSSIYPGPVTIDLGSLSLHCFQSVVRNTNGADEIQSFNATLITTVNMGSGPETVTFSGPMQTIAFGKTGSTTGLFPTEIVSMSLSGDISGTPSWLRESPSLSSSGETIIVAVCDGLLDIYGWYELFSELSVDGGDTWVPVDSSQDLTLEQVLLFMDGFESGSTTAWTTPSP